jgi:hypothetical protein
MSRVRPRQQSSAGERTTCAYIHRIGNKKLDNLLLEPPTRRRGTLQLSIVCCYAYFMQWLQDHHLLRERILAEIGLVGVSCVLGPYRSLVLDLRSPGIHNQELQVSIGT